MHWNFQIFNSVCSEWNCYQWHLHTLRHIDQRSIPYISLESQLLHGIHAGPCNHRVRSLSKPWSHHLCISVFQQCLIGYTWCVFPSRSTFFWIILQCESRLAVKMVQYRIISVPDNLFSCSTSFGSF